MRADTSRDRELDMSVMWSKETTDVAVKKVNAMLAKGDSVVNIGGLRSASGGGVIEVWEKGSSSSDTIFGPRVYTEGLVDLTCVQDRRLA